MCGLWGDEGPRLTACDVTASAADLITAVA